MRSFKNLLLEEFAATGPWCRHMNGQFESMGIRYSLTSSALPDERRYLTTGNGANTRPETS